MRSESAARKQGSIFRRETVELRVEPATELEEYPSKYTEAQDLSVLVINSSQNMAKEITLQLALKLRGCSIMYAPSIEIAKWILLKRDIQLVVSSPLLPDGGISKLNDVLARLESPPDVVIVGDIDSQSKNLFGNSRYEFSCLRRIGNNNTQESGFEEEAQGNQQLDKTVSVLGADIRNDLNNPLQEIVAMVFVAQAAGEESESTKQALSAIDNAARNMSTYVNTLEDKIREAVKLEAV